jgi:asparagine synthase (glutamine-hydrolysing)
MRGYREVTYPRWLDDEFAGRLNLRERWQALEENAPAAVHPARPNGYRSMRPLLWQDFLEESDQTGSLTCSETRHPYLDIRVLRFMLSLPAVPWCCDKYLMRRAFAGVLPRAVLRRPKSPLAADPEYQRARALGMPGLPVREALPGYVNPGRFPATVSANVEEYRTDMRPIALAYWLRGLENSKTASLLEEERNGTTEQPPCFDRQSGQEALSNS